jgi:hypothetical protein
LFATLAGRSINVAANGVKEIVERDSDRVWASQWTLVSGEKNGRGNGKSLGFARDKWGLGQGRNSEIGEDGIQYTRERIARGYQVVKYFAGNGED